MDLSENVRPVLEQKTIAIENALKLIRDDLEKVNLEFRKNLRSDVPIISDIGKYLLESEGKRFRPILLLLSAKLCGYQDGQHIPLASHIEFIHNATLFHDDVVDQAAEATCLPIPNGEMKRVCFSGTSSSPRVFLS